MPSTSGPSSSDTDSLVGLARELGPSIAAHLTHDVPTLVVRSRVPRVLRLAVVVAAGQFAVELDDGPPVALAPVCEPGRAAVRVGRMLAVTGGAR